MTFTIHGDTLDTPSLPVFILRILSPTIVLLTTISLVFHRAVHERPTSTPTSITSVIAATRLPRRSLILAILSLSALTYLLDGLSFVIYATLTKTWPNRTGLEVNAVTGLVAFSGLAVACVWKEHVDAKIWFMSRLKVATLATFILDLFMAVLSGLSMRQQSQLPHFPALTQAYVHFVILAFRVLMLAPLSMALMYPRVVYALVETENGESLAAPTPVASSYLLPPSASGLPSTGLSPLSGLPEASKYGTFRSSHSVTSAPTTRAATPVPSTKADEQAEITLDPSWTELCRRIGRLSPYLWPSTSKNLQALALLCILVVIAGRFVNATVPYMLANIVGILEDGTFDHLWFYLLGYVILRFLQGSGGLAALRDSLWAPVMQYSDLEMSQLSFNHLLNLSFAFHTRRKTGEILRILDRGAAINHTLELLLFNIIPIFVDIIVALVLFSITFEWTLTVVIFLVMASYVSASVVLTRWRTKIRRQMNERDVVTRGIHTDCLLNYETVKYFGGEEHEGNRYRNALREYQTLEYKVIVSLNLLNLVQNFIITVGLLVGSMIVALRVTKGQSSSKDFVYFITYLAQLYGPLNSLGSTYRSVNQSLVDTEKLLKLLNEPTDINDEPGAPDLIVENGVIEFENVSFSYDGRAPALDNISFKVPKGSSVALVGESGSGKSTILRLLYRFYDLKDGEGRILIDGQDIRFVTQTSLRKAIGVIPQDSVLFNTSISYNIGYGKFGASAEEIEAAAKSAQMHDRIMSFPDGYDTKVGERGVRLSGGEKQRVSIARTLLKNPPILLLDEATSALDTSTEKDIQKALQTLQVGRSSLAIAHRLSTIASADTILVLKDGRIVEQGQHSELVARGGVFAAMYHDQSLVHSSGDAPVSSKESVKQEVSPYSIEQGVGGKDDEDADIEVVTADPIVAPVPEALTEQEDRADDTEEQHPTGPSATEVAFPSTPDKGSAAIQFPTSDDEHSAVVSPQAPSAETPASPGVTFDASVNSSRVGSPDPESEPKRKRISSQNFQRLARRISITTRRQGSSSSIIPAIMKRDSQVKSGPVDDSDTRAEGGSLVDSPAGSIKGEDKKKEKEKKKAKRKSTK